MTRSVADGRRVGFHAALASASLRGSRIGVVRNHGDNDSKPILTAAVATLRTQGAEIVDPVVLPPSADYFED